MIRKIEGTTVVITGATSGIGYATALAFGVAGANVVVAGRRQVRLSELVKKLKYIGVKALAVQTEVSDQAQVESLIEQTINVFGRVDTLINNAGVAMAARFDEQSLNDFKRLMDVNFWGAIYASKAVLSQMRKQASGGLIINVSSIFGKRGMPYETAYCASKFALAGFSEALRAEVLSEGIDVSTGCPN